MTLLLSVWHSRKVIDAIMYFEKCDLITAIENVINNRLLRGASVESLRGYIRHMLDIHKKPYLQERIKALALKYGLL